MSNKRELIELRTSHSKVFEHADHSFTRQIYLDAVHYQDEDGSFQDMDDRLTEQAEENTELISDAETADLTAAAQITKASSKKEKELVNKKGCFQVRFKKQAKEQKTVSLTKGSCRMEWGIEGVLKTKAASQGENGLLYPGILEGVDASYRILGEKLKENLIFHTPQSPHAISFQYRLKNLEATAENNRISFYNPEGKEVFLLTAPYMKDAKGVFSEALTLSLEKGNKAGEYRITLTGDSSWLEASERAYPVTLDPVITTSQEASEISDAHVDSQNFGTNYYNGLFLKLMGGDNIQRSFLKFALPDIKSADMVVSARLVLVSLAEDGQEHTLEAHRVLQDWDERTLTWDNRPLYDETIEDFCSFQGDKQKYVTLDITRLVKDWYQNEHNYGLLLKNRDELSGYTEFLASDCHDGYQEMRPRIEISYVNYSGLEDYWSYHSQNIGRAGISYVNDYNGNLILVHPTAATEGSRMPLTLSHTYNSNDRWTNLGYGYGWRLSYHQTLRKTEIGGTTYYKHTEGDGTIHYFYYNTTDKVWKDESGLDLTLTINTANEEAYLIKSKDNQQLVFSKNGTLAKIRDNNGNAVSITWSNARITKLTDGAGRVLTLSYLTNAEGKTTFLDSVTTPAGQTIRFAYTNDNLTSITDADGAKVSYTYGSRRLMRSAAGVDGYQIKYTYHDGKPFRMKTITEYGGGTAGNSLTLTYGYNSTKFTDNKGRSEIYRFNNGGNLLHIHDGFGHAASGKYNRSGNQVNKLENATKLQSNVVQLLKNPIIQGSTRVWIPKIREGAATAQINTNPAYAKVGTQSLQLQCPDAASSACWYQNVKVKKNTAYTFSMYVRGKIEERGTNGRYFLRIIYKDKDGKDSYYDSECLTHSLSSFQQLYTVFSLPSDASSEQIKAVVYLHHLKGTLYADMAQLETGNTASRCNLIDNGDFHLGTLDGYTKSGTAEDLLTTVGTSIKIPVQNALLVTQNAVLYNGPGTSHTPLITVYLGTHVSSHGFVTGSDGAFWYRVRTPNGYTGYLHAASVIAYVAGTSSLAGGVVAVSGEILRAAPSGDPVLYYLPQGTNVVVHNETADASGKKWYRVGFQIESTKYHGYLPADSVAHLSRTPFSGTLKTADSLFQTPSLSSTAITQKAANSTVVLRGILSKQNGETWYLVLHQSTYAYLPSRNVTLLSSPETSAKNHDRFTEKVGGLESHIFKFSGDPTLDKRLTRTLDLVGKKGDVYMVNAWGRGTSLPETDNEKERRFGVELSFVASDGTKETYHSNFSPDILDWQFLSEVFVAKKDYKSIQVSYTYCRNGNLAFVDGLSLYREGYGQTYTYDEDGKVVSAEDEAGNKSQFQYNANQDLTGIVDVNGNTFTYAYDDKHNATKAVSAEKLEYRLSYDTQGNITKCGYVIPTSPEIGSWISRTFTSDKNHVLSVTDAHGSRVQYEWDTAKDLLKSLTDAKGNTLSYAYDSLGRLTSASQTVTLNGTTKTIPHTFDYTKDQLSAIGHHGFDYRFAYDAFGNTKSVSIAGTQVIGYEYAANNGSLEKILYGNGDYIRYTYDTQNRLHLSYHYCAATQTEAKLNQYTYDKHGNLSRVYSNPSGKHYTLYYDFLNRLARVFDRDGSSYEYTYDAQNNITRIYHTVNQSSSTTSCTYDKDNREKTCIMNGKKRTTEYDALGRVSKQTLDTLTPYVISYTYVNNGNSRCGLLQKLTNGGNTLEYTYDANGNVISSKENGKTSTFVYDERNQLIRENNQTEGKTRTYQYDAGGNLLVMKEYTLTSGTLPSAPLRTESGTYNAKWKDQLLSWNGVALTYDAIGNMRTKGNVTYTWTQGRKLTGIQNGKNIQYFYDYQGMRVKKVVDSAVTQYRMAGEQLLSQTDATATIWYHYDSAKRLVGFTTAGKKYFYVRNGQGDIVGIIDSDGNTVVKYDYDSWGKLLQISGSLKDTIGKRNPFRYKGYYYDEETGLYYVNSRYYDPELRRFISADDTDILDVSQEGLLRYNLYAYCENNPINLFDPVGKFVIPTFVTQIAVGAIVNLATTWIAATVTGQSYGLLDGVIAVTTGALAAANEFEFKALAGIVGGLYTAISARNQGASFWGAAAAGVASGVATTFSVSTSISLTCKIELKPVMSGVLDSTFGMAYNATAAAVSRTAIVYGNYNTQSSASAPGGAASGKPFLKPRKTKHVSYVQWPPYVIYTYT